MTDSRALALSCFAGAALPRIASPRDPGPIAGDLAAIRACADRELLSCGAVLFRGFAVPALAEFDAVVRAVTPDLIDYDFASTPRSRVQGRIFTSTEYPAHQHIPLHNEHSYTSEWPMKLWFYCEKAALEGGTTPLADSREVHRRIPPGIRERFAERQVMYVRNYGDGLDLPWENVFGTTERAAVEQFCRGAGIRCEWKADGGLRTRQVCQAVARHPRSSELVWFNQAHLFHISNLEPTAREGLLAAFAEDELPRHAFYGDGSPIEASILDEIRAVYREHTIEFRWQEGDVLLVDNMLVAHGRTPYRGARKILVAMAERHRAEAR